ncbi:helix-turn-helix domain-containing protein [Actinoplanes sp. NPDC049548]|uniref:helix-turn-helix domain-containing protein n=1 Tax=Actinoplanes sp. NPDC049548 TaxID=3155152 RepID=UPI00341E5654
MRVRILAVLREEGPSTATKLAVRLGESSGSTSYHLRQLATHGFIAEHPEPGGGRERWWRAVTGANSLDAAVARQAPEEAEGYLRAVAIADFQRVQDFLATAAGIPSEWDESVTISNSALRLTAAEARELLGRIGALLSDYPADEPGQPAPPGTERVAVQWQVFPQGIGRQQ